VNFPKEPRILERRRASADFQLGATEDESRYEVETTNRPVNEADVRGLRGGATNTDATFGQRKSKYLPAEPGALSLVPLEAASGSLRGPDR
jgi:hypothetical protein